MHPIRWRPTTVIAWLLGATFVHAATPAKTPEDLIGSLIAAARQGATDDFLANLTARSRKAVSESFARQAAVEEAQEVFRQAMDERFGKGAKTLLSAPDDLKSAISRLAGAEILEKKPGPGGTMSVRVKSSLEDPAGKVWTREDTLHLQREDGGAWKLEVAFPQERKPGSKAVLEEFTRRVKDGEFKDRTAAMVALSNALVGPADGKGVAK